MRMSRNSLYQEPGWEDTPWVVFSTSPLEPFGPVLTWGLCSEIPTPPCNGTKPEHAPIHGAPCDSSFSRGALCPPTVHTEAQLVCCTPKPAGGGFQVPGPPMGKLHEARSSLHGGATWGCLDASPVHHSSFESPLAFY